MITIRICRCHITDIAFKNRFNEFIYLLILSLILTGIMSFIPTMNILSLFMFLSILSIVLAITSIRQSNCLIFSVLTKDLGMSIKDLSNYYIYDYFVDRKQISDLFKKECIDGLINLSKKNYGRKVKITTHKWVYENILLDSKVLNLYEVKMIKNGKIKVPQEVLTLNSDDCFKRYKEKLKKSAYQKRDKHKIILIRK